MFSLFFFSLLASTAFLADSQPPNRKALAVYPIFLFYFVISWMIISNASAWEAVILKVRTMKLERYKNHFCIVFGDFIWEAARYAARDQEKMTFSLYIIECTVILTTCKRGDELSSCWLWGKILIGVMELHLETLRQQNNLILLVISFRYIFLYCKGI